MAHTPQEAAKALQLHNSDFLGRSITVDPAIESGVLSVMHFVWSPAQPWPRWPFSSRNVLSGAAFSLQCRCIRKAWYWWAWLLWSSCTPLRADGRTNIYFSLKQLQFWHHEKHRATHAVAGRKQKPLGVPVEGCWFCLGSSSVDISLVASVGNEVYLTLDKGAITDQHVLVVPIDHFPSSVSLSPPCFTEVGILWELLHRRQGPALSALCT